MKTKFKVTTLALALPILLTACGDATSDHASVSSAKLTKSDLAPTLLVRLVADAMEIVEEQETPNEIALHTSLNPESMELDLKSASNEFQYDKNGLEARLTKSEKDSEIRLSGNLSTPVEKHYTTSSASEKVSGNISYKTEILFRNSTNPRDPKTSSGMGLWMHELSEEMKGDFVTDKGEGIHIDGSISYDFVKFGEIKSMLSSSTSSDDANQKALVEKIRKLTEAEKSLSEDQKQDALIEIINDPFFDTYLSYIEASGSIQYMGQTYDLGKMIRYFTVWLFISFGSDQDPS